MDRGESGSGKTAVRAEVVSALLAKSASPLSQKLSHATYVFDCLTTTKTTTTPTASKAGLFFELQYATADATNPNLIGGKLLDHRLERSRIASVPTGERNFHILYYLLAGTSGAEKTHLGLDENHGLPNGAHSNGPKRWRYLGHQSQLKVGVDDAGAFQYFKTALRKLEFPRQNIAEICQVLAAILHIGQLEFETADDTTPTGDESGGYSHEGANTVTVVRNKETLAIIAAFLQVGAQELQTTFGYKTKMLNKERVTLMLDPAGAKDNADELARTLYSLLVAYIIEQCNQRLCAAEDSVSNTISIVDFPGFLQQTSQSSHLDQLFNNAATEMLYNFTLKNFFEKKAELLDSEEVNVPVTSYFDNSPTVTGLLKHNNGLLSILDDQTRKHRTDQQLLETLRKRFEGKNPAISVSSGVSKLPGSNFATYNTAASFTVKHFAGEVDYPVNGLIEANGEIISGDLMNLINNTKSAFVGQLFGQEALQTVVHPQEKTTIMQAQVSSKPMRKPSVMRKGRTSKLSMKFGDEKDDNSDDLSDTGTQATKKAAARDVQQGAAAQFLTSIDNVRKSLMGSNANCYFVFCLKPNDRRIANQFDSKCVRTQLQTFGIAEISQRLRAADFSVFLPFGEFVGLAESEQILVGSEREKVEMVVDAKRWPANEATIGSTGIFLSERCWMSISNLGEGLGGHYPVPSDDGGDSLTPGYNNGFGDSGERLQIPGRAGGAGYFGAAGAKSEADASEFGRGGDMFKNMETREEMAEKGNQKQMVEVEEIVTSASRKRWVFFVYLLTWPIPDFLVKWIGRMKRKDVRMAWREKFAINLLIWLSCLFVIFFIVVFPMLICPKQHVYSAAELSAFNGKKGSRGAYVAIRGQVFDLEKFAPAHQPSVVSKTSIMNYAGKDATGLFPVQVSALCEGKLGFVDATVPLDYTGTNQTGSATQIDKDDINAKYHDFRHWTNDSRPDWFYQQMILLRSNYKKGNIGYPPTYLKTLAEKQQPIAVLNNRVYDFSMYMRGGRTPKAPTGDEVNPDIDVNFMDQKVVDLFTYHAGNDLTKEWDILDIDPGMRQRMQMCLDNLFYVGDLDTRNSVQCQFAAYLVLVISIILCSVIVFKFFAALQFGTKNIPEHLDKFIMCQVPAYTEDEESLRRAIDSAARMRYDDKRKLLVIICDGMIIGQGNDKPTPRIVLDILGVNETVDPEPLSFESLGEGAKQHNMGKVYSGLYEVQGHIVPFLVVVKIGKPSEVSRPGNRGKRDSQMIMMRFLNRVHYNAPMSPLELEMYHQIRNIIGVNPTFYEFMLQIDADTIVAPDAASRMVSAFLDDTRLIGVCGETALANSKSSFITMIQVYEYYISHNLSKAFESLFGSVTCLPGCFTMYRVRAADSGKPLFVSREVCDAYANIRVDTLHMKNLLHLGEDRYLTTLLLKYHSKYKTKYIFDAHAWTIAPDDWKIFLSQRRRWINSTVHNLLELAPMTELCGFCCFSMRFVVFIDLLSTIVQPVTLAYIVYLIYTCITNPTTIPITAFILLGAIYGLQAFIFIVRRKWEMIGWMILYIIAIPVFTFALPLYSFWHMDDFSWGNTRVVTGEAGRKVVITDEGKFDPASVPKKKWEEYQAELWEMQGDLKDDATEVSGYSYATKSYGQQNPYAPQSEYGMPPSRPMSSMTGLGGGNNPFGDSRTSVAMATPMQERPQSMFNMGHEVEMMNLQALPTDDALLAEIREILATSDLMTVSKKSVKLELERRFGVPLDGKRAYINNGMLTLLAHY